MGWHFSSGRSVMAPLESPGAPGFQEMDGPLAQRCWSSVTHTDISPLEPAFPAPSAKAPSSTLVANPAAPRPDIFRKLRRVVLSDIVFLPFSPQPDLLPQQDAIQLHRLGGISDVNPELAG